MHRSLHKVAPATLFTLVLAVLVMLDPVAAHAAGTVLPALADAAGLDPAALIGLAGTTAAALGASGPARRTALAALQAARARAVDGMTAIADAAAAENRDLTADEQAAFDALKAEDDGLVRRIALEQDLERRASAVAVPVATGGGAPIPRATSDVKDPAMKGVRAARIVRALAATRGIPQFAAQFASEAWGDDQLFANQNLSTHTAGGVLVPDDVASELIELLRPASVVMAMGPRVIPMPNANLTIPRVATGTNAGYVGEQQASPATGMTMGAVRLVARKLSALVPISNDLLRAASVAVDQLVRDDLVAACAQRMDLAFIRSIGGEFTPRGLRFLAPTAGPNNVLIANATVNAQNVTTDLGRLVLALVSNNVPMLNPGYLISPRTERYLLDLRDGNGNFLFRGEMRQGLLNGYPYRRSQQIPENLGGGSNQSEIYFVDFAQVVVGEFMGLTLDTSTEAAYVDAASTMQAAFSRDETVIRAIVQHDLNVRHLPAVAVLTQVVWQ